MHMAFTLVDPIIQTLNRVAMLTCRGTSHLVRDTSHFVVCASQVYRMEQVPYTNCATLTFDNMHRGRERPRRRQE